MKLGLLAVFAAGAVFYDKTESKENSIGRQNTYEERW